jgi:Zn-dependent M28 family amino/carboxypeptidase
MKTFRLAAVSAIALAAAPLSAASMDGFSPYRLSQVDKTISADDFQGRGVNTLAETKTVNYIIDQFRSAGLEPGGDLVGGKRKWTQDVPLLQSEFTADPVVTVQTPAGPVHLAQGDQIAVRPPQNGQNQISIANAPLVFVGYGVTAPERSWDDFKGVDVKGKVIVVLVNDPDFEGGEGDFGGKAMTYYGRWTYKYEEAARRGAAGVMIVHETAPASYGWNTVKNSNTNTQFDIVRQNPAGEHTPFETWIQRDVAVQLFRNAGLDFERAKAAAKLRNFQPIDLKETMSATANANVGTITSHNVAGILPGKKYPDETVIYSAHWDHLGVGKPDARGDTIYNGAVDNATGISQLVEQARAFVRGPRPERSVLFLAVTAEEKGLLGSEYYATHPLYPLAKTVGVLNTDSMGVWGPEKNFSISGTAKLDLLDDLIAAGKQEGRYFTPDPHPESGGFYRSDHFSFAKQGVPAISFKPGNDLVNGGITRGEALASKYTAERYHQPADEFNAGGIWDFRGMAQDAYLLHLVGERLANSREWPNWSADSEFRATRDKSAAERENAQPTVTPKKGERG